MLVIGLLGYGSRVGRSLQSLHGLCKSSVVRGGKGSAASGLKLAIGDAVGLPGVEVLGGLTATHAHRATELLRHQCGIVVRVSKCGRRQRFVKP